MAKFRKKPLVIEAEQYRRGLEDDWEYEDRLPDVTDGMFAASRLDGVRLYPYLNTLEGRHYISAGDWIITGVKGERYPCKPDIFAATYEPADVPVKLSQRGIFRISQELLWNNPAAVVEMFAQLRLVPVRVEVLFMEQVLQYSAYSPYFAEVPEVCATPDYLITEQTDGDTVTYGVVERGTY